jgi:PmbA protein
MFAGIQAVGSDVDVRGNIRCGSVLLDKMMIAAG